MASAGLCSRRAADRWIEDGRITINGVVAELGALVRPGVDRVACDGRPVGSEEKLYLAFNKPVGVICTNAVRERRRRVIDCLPGIQGRLYTVGRLDADSEGLILVTNDGAFTQAIAHPSNEVEKCYRVLVQGTLRAETLQQARDGVWIGDCHSSPAQVEVLEKRADATDVLMTIHEGRNREIRRIFGRLGHPVLRLRRLRIGSLELGDLALGAYRHLSEEEVAAFLGAPPR